MKKSLPLAVALLLAVSAVPLALSQATRTTGAATATTLPVEKLEAMAAANQPSLVIVEYQLQYDKGDAPEANGTAERCPSCGRYHSTGNIERYLEEERLVERAGVLVDGVHVVTEDLQMHPRFIKSITVRTLAGDAKTAPRVTAAISAFPKRENALLLELAGPLAGAKPAAFDAQRTGPYTVLNLTESEGRWNIGLQSLPQDLILIAGKSFYNSSRGLVLDKDGGPVAMTTGIEIPADGSWKTSPLQWPAFSAAAMKDLLAKVQTRSDKGIVPVTLNFRSPKNGAAVERYSSREDNPTLQHALGVFVDAKTILVLSNMKATTTARLERIRVLTNPPMDAKFTASLKDYGAFVATTPTPVTGNPGLSTADLHTLRGAALPAANILLQGENRVPYYQHLRIASLNVGFQGNLYPEVPGNDANLFLFDDQGDLVALPVAARPKAGAESRYSYGSSTDAVLTSVTPLGKALKNLAENSDPNNVPVTEDQENRLAWLGFELQPLNSELARANNVADQTKDGQLGALVTFVYPDSPASKAGVEPGWVLLRVNVAGQPKPIEVQLESDRYSDEPFPWDRLDEVSERSYDRIPNPWPSTENTLLRSLTDLGFGKKFVAQFAHDKKIEDKDFTVVQGPLTYDSAPKYKSAGMGVTVRDLTYEVRRYMQKKDNDPGVIISKIEMGGKSSLAGLKPYEVITHVNDQPVLNVKDFENASKDQTDLRLTVKRMNNGRIVKITLPKSDAALAATAPATEPK